MIVGAMIHFGKDFDPRRDILINRSPEDAVSFR